MTDLDIGGECFLPRLLNYDPYDLSYVDTHVAVCQTADEEWFCGYVSELSHDPAVASLLAATASKKVVHTVPSSWTLDNTTPSLPQTESIDPRVLDSQQQADELYRAMVDDTAYPPTPESVRTYGSDDEQCVPAATATPPTSQHKSTRRRTSLPTETARGRTSPAGRASGARTARRASPQRGASPPPEKYPEMSAEEIEDVVQRISGAIALAIVREAPNGEDYGTLYRRFYKLHKDYVFEATNTLRQVGHSTMKVETRNERLRTGNKTVHTAYVNGDSYPTQFYTWFALLDDIWGGPFMRWERVLFLKRLLEFAQLGLLRLGHERNHISASLFAMALPHRTGQKVGDHLRKFQEELGWLHLFVASEETGDTVPAEIISKLSCTFPASTMEITQEAMDKRQQLINRIRAENPAPARTQRTQRTQRRVPAAPIMVHHL